MTIHTEKLFLEREQETKQGKKGLLPSGLANPRLSMVSACWTAVCREKGEFLSSTSQLPGALLLCRSKEVRPESIRCC